MIKEIGNVIARLVDGLSGRPDEYTVMEFQARGLEVYDLKAET